MRILAIDPGTNLGWAVNKDPVDYGHLSLATKRTEGAGMRYVRLKSMLTDLKVSIGDLDLVVFEEVRRHLGTQAAHVYGGIIAVLMMWCESHDVAYISVPVQHVKKFATGKGNATKSMMVDAAIHKYGLESKPTEDEADALAILGWAVAEYGG